LILKEQIKVQKITLMALIKSSLINSQWEEEQIMEFMEIKTLRFNPLSMPNNNKSIKILNNRIPGKKVSIK
jgi:hypothetical protein